MEKVFSNVGSLGSGKAQPFIMYVPVCCIQKWMFCFSGYLVGSCRCEVINTALLPGDFTVKQKAEVSRSLTVISADLAKLTIDVFWGGGEMLRREKLKCPRETISPLEPVSFSERLF